ncbi:DUF2339 domain-containing protein [Cellvibrio sp. PSBB006]|uniref:DUF2339 domain-containing protein n=1 Tax=Cellvibrio sp. PSBB006 TaxID=1987723 RepID=UPI000B3B49A7|nr:DUF2339 domain-containing protein [Cellvibrio sp. PSBB006]ARU26482.1 hypothetical protein CBR65_03090 [Cellvibrio sp. PSBB006]
MNITIVLTLVGIILGAISLGYGGWLAGGVIGYLAGQLKNLSDRHKQLEREVVQLKQSSTPATSVPVQPLAEPVQTPFPASTTAAEKPLVATTQKAPAQSNTAVVPNSPSPLAASPQTDTPPQTVAALAQARQQTHPAKPDPFDKVAHAIRRFFTEGNVIVRIGMVVMFFGLSFLVKYASNQGLLPIELRLTAVAAVAIALIVLGWKTRNRAGGYGLVLQGGGVAALYLTIFAATKIYTLMPSAFAFALMLVVVIFGVFLSVLQNAQILALMATAGGFLAPILTSDGSGNHVALFTFYLILNLGILAVAWFKTWRTLNWVGFIFTFMISVVWGVLRYEPQLYASTQPFLLAFFLLYLALSVLFSLKQPPKLTGLVDGTLIFGLPLVAFGLQAELLHHTEYGLAISAVILAMIYGVVARWLWVKHKSTQQLLIDSFTALAVGFATLAIPLAMGAAWTSASWALEAIGLIWIGLRQGRLLSRVAGYLLHIAAAVTLLSRGELTTGYIPLLIGDFINLFVLAASALLIAWLLYRHLDALLKDEKYLELIAMLIGWGWWLIAGINEIAAHVSEPYLFATTILFFALSTLAMLLLSRLVHWQSLTRTGFWLLPLTALSAGVYHGWSVLESMAFHPAQGFGWMALLVFVAVQYRFLWRSRADSRSSLLSIYHVATAWFLLCLLFWEASWLQQQNNWQDTAAAVLWFVCFALPVVVLIKLNGKTIWPFTTYANDYRHIIPAPLLFLLLLWFIKVSTFAGTVPFVYVPILNPVDLAQLAAILLLFWSFKANLVNLAQATADIRHGLIAGAGFVWVNLVLLRAIHHYGEVAYEIPALWDSAKVQMALSILWVICALIVMNLSRRMQDRHWWIAGAALLGLVVLKLFTKDLTDSGTLARVVSFMVVGAVMLLIGYLSPIPAKTTTNAPDHPSA